MSRSPVSELAKRFGVTTRHVYRVKKGISGNGRPPKMRPEDRAPKGTSWKCATNQGFLVYLAGGDGLPEKLVGRWGSLGMAIEDACDVSRETPGRDVEIRRMRKHWPEGRVSWECVKRFRVDVDG